MSNCRIIESVPHNLPAALFYDHDVIIGFDEFIDEPYMHVTADEPIPLALTPKALFAIA